MQAISSDRHAPPGVRLGQAASRVNAAARPGLNTLARGSSRLTGVRALVESDRDAVRAHLLRLSLEDRALRFACAISDELIESFATTMSLDGSLGLFLDGELAGMAHLPHLSPDEVELGISLDARSRTHGWGRMLLGASLESTYATGHQGLTACYATYNRPMAQLLRGVATSATRSGTEITARVELEDWAAQAHASNRLIEAEA